MVHEILYLVAKTLTVDKNIAWNVATFHMRGTFGLNALFKELKQLFI